MDMYLLLGLSSLFSQNSHAFSEKLLYPNTEADGEIFETNRGTYCN